MGIDDFTRQIIGVVHDIKLPSVNSFIGQGDPLCIISGNEKTLHLYAPLEGKIIDINPDIIDNPSLVSIAPHGRGWILSVEPSDVLQASKELLSGRSAIEWLKHESHKFYDFLREETEIAIPADGSLPPDFGRTLKKEIWDKIDKAFFMVRQKRKVELHSVGYSDPGLKKDLKSN
jgi:glycine cleavage system H protein